MRPSTSTTATINDPTCCQRNPSTDALIVLSALALIVASVLVPLRTYVRLRVTKSFWWDDVCLIFAHLLLVPQIAMAWWMVSLGYGRHITCLPADNILQISKLGLVAQELGIFATVSARVSVALFVIRLFAVSKRVRIFLSCYTVFMAVSLSVTGLLIFATCTPVNALWDPELARTAKCWSVEAREFRAYYNGTVAILSDILLALLPAYFLRKLKIQTRLKVILASLMAVGLIPAVCAMCRTFVSMNQDEADFTYATAILSFFGVMETASLVICAAIPALRPLFRSMRRTENTTAYARGKSSQPSRETESYARLAEAKTAPVGAISRKPSEDSIRTSPTAQIIPTSNKNDIELEKQNGETNV